MKARLTLRPGSKGTKKLSKQYGEKLLYVRYRYDEIRKKRLKTVELIVDEQDWMPNEQDWIPDEPAETADNRFGNRIVRLRIGFGETELREKIKEAGGRWDRKRKLWEIPYEKVPDGLEERIV